MRSYKKAFAKRKSAKKCITANVCKHFVAETRQRDEEEEKAFVVGWSAMSIKNVPRSFSPVREIPRESQSCREMPPEETVFSVSFACLAGKKVIIDDDAMER